jgi:hypothetical protein
VRVAFRSVASFVACGCRCSPGVAGRIGGRIVTWRIRPERFFTYGQPAGMTNTDYLRGFYFREMILAAGERARWPRLARVRRWPR